jgi:hypothetical protein
VSSPHQAHSQGHRRNAHERQILGASTTWTNADIETLKSYAGKATVLQLAWILGGRHSIDAIGDEVRKVGAGGPHFT